MAVKSSGKSIKHGIANSQEREVDDMIKQVKSYLIHNFKMTPETAELMLAEAKKSLNKGFSEAEGALAQANQDDLTRSCHSLKGVMLNLGLLELAEKAQFIEKAPLRDGQEGIKKLEKELRDLKQGVLSLM